MNYEQTLDFLFTQLPMYQRQGAPAMKKDLTNVRLLLAALGNPERRMGKIIHVGGTNGKGSTSTVLANLLTGRGFRVGLYTSPHYRDFRERIRVDLEMIGEEAVVAFVARIRPELERIRPSFFEITVAMAFAHFASVGTDWCVVEVGLGGRLDSTNVVVPVLSVITSIGLDHTQFLGDTLAEIAGEKAGIIKPGVPVVVGETRPETAPVFERVAAAREAPLTFADRVYTVSKPKPTLGNQTLAVTENGVPWSRSPFAGVFGPHQEKNLQTVLTASAELFRAGQLERPFAFTELMLHGMLHRHKGSLGRWQRISTEPPAIADGAHNREGLTRVIEQLRRLVRSDHQLHIVLGFVNDKDLDSVLPLFPKPATYYFVKADIPRGLPPETLAAAAAPYGLHGAVYSSVKAGYEAALGAVDSDGLVFVGGSIFTVGEVV